MRKFNLSAAILAVVGNSIFLVMGFIQLIGLIQIDSSGIDEYYVPAGTWLLVAVGIVLAITSIILSSLTFSLTKASNAKYQSRKGLSIAAIVLNIIAAILVLLYVIASAAAGVIAMIIIMLIILLLLVVSAAFYITDLCISLTKIEKENSELLATNAASGLNKQVKIEKIIPTKVTTDIKQQVPAKKEIAKPEPTVLEKKLMKLKEMKDTGILDEEEYKQMKAKAIKDELSKSES